MNPSLAEATLEALRAVKGDVGFYARTLPGGAPCEFQADLPLVAASVIKLPILVEAFARFAEGTLREDEVFEIRPEHKMPSCGALTYLHDGLKVTALDLATLMIILSDNTATNLLIDRLGIEAINARMAALGIPDVALRRKLFDAEQSARGIENTVTARGMGLLLERMVAGTLLGPEADARMLKILGDQRLNGKLPFYLHSADIDVAHKTGEDEGITHDVGVVFSREPFVICMLSNRVDVPPFERLIQDTARAWAGLE